MCASKPIFSIAAMTSAAPIVLPSVYVTVPLLVSKLTFTSSTPSNLLTAFSTRPTQAAQCMPIIENSSLCILPPHAICFYVKDTYIYYYEYINIYPTFFIVYTLYKFNSIFLIQILQYVAYTDLIAIDCLTHRIYTNYCIQFMLCCPNIQA